MFTEEQQERILKEKQALQELCMAVQIDWENGYVALRGYPFPRGWNTDRSTLLYDLSRSYPQMPPKGGYIPEDIRYHGRLPEYLLNRTQHGYRQLCIHHRDLSKDWEPDCHTMVTLTRCVNKALRNPEVTNPWRRR